MVMVSFKNSLSVISRMGLYAGILAVCPLSLTLCSSAQAAPVETTPGNNIELGLELETNFWKAVLEKDVKKYSDKLSHIDQNIINNGDVSDKIQKIAALSSLLFSDFAIQNAVVTKTDDHLIISYNLILIEQATSTTFHVLTTWKEHDKQWKIVSQAFFGTLG